MDNQDLHLYSRPKYSAGGKWFDCFPDAMNNCPLLTLDETAIMEIMSFNWSSGDRTIFKEIKRQPWLSSLDETGTYKLAPIPPHGRLWATPSTIAKKLKVLLAEEILTACENKKQIFVLLSGGLDSRVLAGILSELYTTGKLPAKPVCVTWGISNCRDIEYAKAAASLLKFDWEHIELQPEHVLENIVDGSPVIGCLTSPTHLHRMLWFKNLDKSSVVLAASWGDSIGRAEFSGKHLLELTKPNALNILNLMNKNVLPGAIQGVDEDFEFLRQRNPDVPVYALREYEMQGFYMRGMIGQALSLIDNYSNLYQIFSAPKVYSFMWSLHPVRRDNSIYAALFEDLPNGLARLPWARTNRSLKGKTVGALENLSPKFHQYQDWISGPLYENILSLIDLDWFAETGIFNTTSIKMLNESMAPNGNKCKEYKSWAYDIWPWLAALKSICDSVPGKLNKTVAIDNSYPTTPQVNTFLKNMRIKLRKNKYLYNTVSLTRRLGVKTKALFKYPPHKMK